MINIKINGQIFKVAKSKRKNKKYDVFKDENFILSFGDTRYSHYKDKFKLYSKDDHNDLTRLKNFRNRFKTLYEKNKNNPLSSIYWSWNYLW